MSSSTSLTRARSLRKPGNNGLNDNDASLSRDDLRNASPSRLPVKGPPSSRAAPQAASTTGAGGNGNGNGGNSSTGATAKSKPTSGIFGRAAPVRQQPQGNASAASSTATSRPPITTRNRPAAAAAAARPTSASGGPSSSSATNLSRPTSSSGVPSSSATTRTMAARGGHARTKSSATVLTGATVLRPPSQTSAATTVAAPAEKTRYPPSSRTLHQRKPSASTISTSAAPSRQARAPAGGVGPATTRQARPKSFSVATSKSTPTSQPPEQQQQPRLRPAFNTLQQHYSPAKSLAPKPLTATYLAPPSPSKLPANVAASAETARLQTELLQLHLLHRDAAPAAAAWANSARARLGGRFRDVAREGDDVGRLESRAVERLNAAALRDWTAEAGAGPTRRLEDRVQALDAVLSNVWSLGEPGGRYARLVRRFERWAESAAGIIEARGGESLGGAALLPGEELVFVGDLDASWRDDCAGLARRLDGWGRLLAELGVAAGGDDEEEEEEDDDDREPRGRRGGWPASSLSRILGACGSLVHDMLAELDLMLQIERDAAEQENEWIRSMGKEAAPTHGAGPGAGAIWRVL